MESKLTDSDCAISSSGTSSGLKAAGVSHEHDWFNGNRVTITSPFAKHSIHLLFKRLNKNSNSYTLKILYLEHVDKWFLKIYSFK
jgi:hypothetical protein